MNKIRKIPLVCLMISIIWLLLGKLRLSKKFLDEKIINNDGKVFTLFRNISIHHAKQESECCVFIVSFKFSRLSHKANKLTSIIPMLLITGFPGFIQKIYAVDFESGYWQGMYQWKSRQHLEDYKKSFVYRMMNRRAEKGSVKSIEILHYQLVSVHTKN